MSLESEMLLDAKLIMCDGLLRSNPPGLEVDKNCYVADWRSNLLPDIDAALIEQDFLGAKGSELERKFCAAHSSAALAVNVFGRFRDGRGAFPMPGLGMLNLIRFEKPSQLAYRAGRPHTWMPWHEVPGVLSRLNRNV